MKRWLLREALWFVASVVIGAVIAFGASLSYRPSQAHMSFVPASGAEPWTLTDAPFLIPIEILRGAVVYAAIGCTRLAVWSLAAVRKGA